MKLIIIDNSIAGTTTDNDPNNYTLVDMPEGYMDAPDEWQWLDGVLVHDPIAALARAKSNAIATIKAQAAQRIEAMAWRIERANERALLGLAGDESHAAVLAEREAWRRASNRVHASIEEAATPAEISAITLELLPVDYVSPARITRMEFLNRFTDDEMQAFIAASKQAPALEAYLLKLQNAEGVLLGDPTTVGGVQALELIGIIGDGRAAEILSLAEIAVL